MLTTCYHRWHVIILMILHSVPKKVHLYWPGNRPILKLLRCPILRFFAPQGRHDSRINVKFGMAEGPDIPFATHDNQFFSEPPMPTHNWLFSEPPKFGGMQHTFSQMKKLCILRGSVVTFFRYDGQGGNSLFSSQITYII